MKKKIVFFILILITIISLSSCFNGNKVLYNNDRIQLWYYAEFDAHSETNILKIVNKVQEFCDKNGLTLEVFKYDSKILSQDDYKLKRNISAAMGNMIIIEDISSLRDLSDQHADYTKISNYNTLLNAYKDRFCIPFGTLRHAMYIENDAMQYYGIKSGRRLITYTEYLNIKQKMKERGARFKFNYKEFNQIIHYYQHSNGLLFVDEESEIINDKDLFKKAIKKAITEVYNDIFLNHNFDIEYMNYSKEDPLKETIYDETSSLILQESSRIDGELNNFYRHIMNDSNLQRNVKDIPNKTYFINPLGIHYYSINFFMYKKITNDKMYDLLNYIINEETYRLVNTHNDGTTIEYVPIFNTDNTKELLNINDNFEFIGKQYISPREIKEIREVKSNFYEMIFQDGAEAKEIADYHFFNKSYQWQIENFIRERVKEIINYFYDRDISLNIIDIENEEVNKIIDEKIDKYAEHVEIYY